MRIAEYYLNETIKKYSKLKRRIVTPDLNEEMEEKITQTLFEECKQSLRGAQRVTLDVIDSLRRFKEGVEVEKHAFGTAVFISDDPPNIPQVNLRISSLPSSGLHALQSSHIRELFQIADGRALALWVNTSGDIKGFLDLGSYTGPKEDLFFKASENGKLAVSIIPEPNPAYQIFYNGDLICEEYRCSKKQKKWRIRFFPELFEEDFSILASEIDQEVLKRIVYAAVTLSHEGYGAIFVVGKEKEVVGVKRNGKPMGLDVEASVNVRELSIGALCNLARRDGATIIDAEGNLLATAWHLNPKGGCCRELKSYGSRHLTACNISCEITGLVVTVSVDNLITFFKEGIGYEF